MLLTMREKTRVEAVQAVMDRRLSVAQAAIALNLSERQVYRTLAAARGEGLTGLVRVESRLAGARTLAEANRVLARFLPDYNRRFRVALGTGHRSTAAGFCSLRAKTEKRGVADLRNIKKEASPRRDPPLRLY